MLRVVHTRCEVWGCLGGFLGSIYMSYIRNCNLDVISKLVREGIGALFNKSVLQLSARWEVLEQIAKIHLSLIQKGSKCPSACLKVFWFLINLARRYVISDLHKPLPV